MNNFNGHDFQTYKQDCWETNNLKKCIKCGCVAWEDQDQADNHGSFVDVNGVRYYDNKILCEEVQVKQVMEE